MLLSDFNTLILKLFAIKSFVYEEATLLSFHKHEFTNYMWTLGYAIISTKCFQVLHIECILQPFPMFVFRDVHIRVGYTDDLIRSFSLW